MKPAITDGSCRLRGGHCAWCLTHPEWRAQVGTVNPCPEGVTLDSLPLKAGKAVYRKKGCGTCKPVTA